MGQLPVSHQKPLMEAADRAAASIELMVFEQLFCSSPRRRALLRIAEGSSPTAIRDTGFIAVLKYVDSRPGLPRCARRPLPATGVGARHAVPPTAPPRGGA